MAAGRVSKTATHRRVRPESRVLRSSAHGSERSACDVRVASASRSIRTRCGVLITTDDGRESTGSGSSLTTAHRRDVLGGEISVATADGRIVSRRRIILSAQHGRVRPVRLILYAAKIGSVTRARGIVLAASNERKRPSSLIVLPADDSRPRTSDGICRSLDNAAETRVTLLITQDQIMGARHRVRTAPRQVISDNEISQSRGRSVITRRSGSTLDVDVRASEIDRRVPVHIGGLTDVLRYIPKTGKPAHGCLNARNTRLQACIRTLQRRDLPLQRRDLRLASARSGGGGVFVLAKAALDKIIVALAVSANSVRIRASFLDVDCAAGQRCGSEKRV